MRVLFSGVLGAVASATAWQVAEHLQQTNFGWMVCLIGLVTGYLMHKASKATAGSTGGFARGALAVALTLAAIVGGQKAYAMYMQASSPPAGAVAAGSLQVVDDASDPGSAKKEGGAALDLSSVLSEEAPNMGQGSYSKSAIKNNFSDWDMIWMGLAALAAYVTGKGGGGATRVAATEELREEAADARQEPSEPEDD